MPKKRPILFIALTLLILLSACQPAPVEPPLGNGDTHEDGSHAAKPTPLPGWTIYHNEKYSFTLDLPPGWQVMETPNQEYPTESEQIWLSAEAFPPFAQEILPDVLVTIFQDSPASRWEPHYYEDYSVELLIGKLPVEGTYITGLNKETGRREEVVIAHLPGSAFLELQRTGVDEMSAIFNQIVSTLRPVEKH